MKLATDRTQHDRKSLGYPVAIIILGGIWLEGIMEPVEAVNVCFIQEIWVLG